MNEFAPGIKKYGCFVVRNITPDSNKTIKIFNYPILFNQTRDLLQIPGVSESDIRASLLKGELRHKILSKDIVVECSDVDLLQFNDDQKTFLQSAGIINGLDVSGSTVQNTLMFNTNKIFFNISLLAGSSKVTISLTGGLKHSDDIDNIGVPVFDQGPFESDPISCYVQIVDPYYNDVFFVQTGDHQGEKIIGITNAGASISPDSVEILFYSIKFGDKVTTDNITPYIWEDSQLDTANICCPFVDRIEQIDFNMLRSTMVSGLIPEAYIQKQILETNGTLVYINDGDIVTKT